MSITIAKKEELKEYIGKETGVSEWFEIDQDRINAFADATLDHQFIHVDPEAAAISPFGTTIAHGFLTLSLLSHLCEHTGLMVEGIKMGVNYGMNKVRFLTPVKVGSKVRARMTLLDIVEKGPGQFLLTTNITVDIEGIDKPALIAEWLTMQFTG